MYTIILITALIRIELGASLALRRKDA
jgi:hypothetical protein